MKKKFTKKLKKEDDKDFTVNSKDDRNKEIAKIGMDAENEAIVGVKEADNN